MHARMKIRFCFFALVTVLLGLVAAPALVAAPPEYRVVDLSVLGFPVNIETYGSMGINAKGQCVFGYWTGGSYPETGQMHAWIWLPEADPTYNLPGGMAQGFHDISALSASTADAHAIAYDINESGVVVGQVEYPTEGATEAVAWKLAVTGNPVATPLGYFPGGDNGLAEAVNNVNPPEIVGTSNYADQNCVCGGGSGSVARAFRITFGSSLGTMTAMNPLVNDGSSKARDINTPLSGSPLIVGISGCNEGGATWGSVCAQLDNCGYVQVDAARWVTSTADELTEIASQAHEGRGVSDLGAACGWGYNGTACIKNVSQKRNCFSRRYHSSTHCSLMKPR